MRVITRAAAVTEASRETAKDLSQQKRQQGNNSNDFEAVFEKACKTLERKRGGSGNERQRHDLYMQSVPGRSETQ